MGLCFHFLFSLLGVLSSLKLQIFFLLQHSLLVYMYVSCVWQTLFPWSLSSALTLTIFPPLLLLRSLRFEEKGVIRRTFRAKLNKDSQSLTEHDPVVGLCFNFHLLQTESFQVMAEGWTDLMANKMALVVILLVCSCIRIKAVFPYPWKI